MNETETQDPWVATETWVTYHGKRRTHLSGMYKVVKANAESAAFDAGIYGEQWCARKYLKVVDTTKLADWERELYGMETSDLDKVFSDAAGGHREMLVNETKRLKDRLAELESALKVIDSL